MKTILYLSISIRIIGLFSTGFLMSFITPRMHYFLGDIKLEEPLRHGIDRGYEWSASHYWFFWCMFTLFALSVINFIVWIFNAVPKAYPNTKF